MTTRIAILMLSLLITGCSSGPPPKLFLLEPLLDPLGDELPPGIDAVGVAVVELPAYASDQRLASRVGDAQIAYDDNIKWADSPEDAITRVLANRLRYYLEATAIVEPFPRGYKPQARIEVVFDKILREATGGAELAGQIRLISGDGKKVTSVRPFQFVRFAESRQPDEFFRAVSAGINDVARMAASALVVRQN